MIENVHRANLKPVEQAKAILEVFKSSDSAIPRMAINDRLPQKIQHILDKHRGHTKGNLEVFKASNTSAPGALIDDKLPQKIYGETHPKEEVVATSANIFANVTDISNHPKRTDAIIADAMHTTLVMLHRMIILIAM